MARVKAQEAGERIFTTLSEHPGGFNRTMLCFEANLTESQLAGGLEWFRDLFDEYEAIVRLRIGGEWIYKLPSSEADCLEHMGRDLRTQITRARGEYNRAHKFASAYPTAANEYQEELARRRLVDLRYAYDRFCGQEQLAS